MWERRPTDHDFCHVRVGVGTHRLATRLMAPETGPPEDLEPVSTVALRRFVTTHSVVHALPTAVSLRAFPTIRLRRRPRSRPAVGALDDPGAVRISRPGPSAGRSGDRGPGRRELELGQVAAARTTSFGASTDAAPCGCCSRRWSSWRTRWHPISPSVVASPETPSRRRDSNSWSSSSTTATSPVTNDWSPMPGWTASPCSTSTPGLTARRQRRGLQLVVEGDDVGARTAAGTERFATPDRLTLAEAEATARAFSRFRPGGAAHIVSLESDSRAADPGLMALLKIPDAAEIVPEEVWRTTHRTAAPSGARRLHPFRTTARAGHQGVRRGWHGPARPVHRRNRVGQVGVPAHAGIGDDHLALARGVEPGSGGLQGWGNVSRARRRPAHRRDHHQPRRRTDDGRPDA